jgi:hypothetical protein
LRGDTRVDRILPLAVKRIDGLAVLNPVDEVGGMETNHASQWSLNAIEVLALVGDYAPAELGAKWGKV